MAGVAELSNPGAPDHRVTADQSPHIQLQRAVGGSALAKCCQNALARWS